MFHKITDFIHQLYQTDDLIPLHPAYFCGNEKKYLNECIDTTYVSSVGAFVDRFERDVAAYTKCRRAVVCVSGTNALHMALLLCNVERDDEVLTQPLTFVATCNALSYIGAHPVFLDVDRDTLGLSPAKMSEWLAAHAVCRNGRCVNKNTGRRIKACVPMHTFGHPVRLQELLDICRTYDIELIEDAAEAIGSLYHGQHAGTFGKIGVLSFNGNKTITTGGGGMMLFNDEELAARAKHITTQAKIPHPWEFRHDHIGYNYRMPNINAALGCAQLENIEKYIADKRQTAAAYQEFFAGFSDISFVVEPEHCRSNYWLNAIIFQDPEKRDEFLEFSNANKVMTRPVWTLMNHLEMFRNCECGDLSNAGYLESRLVNIPSGIRNHLE